MNKKRLLIPSLKTVQEILDDFDFLEYSTRKRNLAYQLQYLEFKANLLKTYSIYGTVKSILLKEVIMLITNIIEYLLFVSLCTIYKRDPKSHKLPQLVGQARAKELVNRSTARDLNKIVKLRNRLHPSKQKQKLDIHCFTQRNARFCLSTMYKLKSELKEFFRKQNIQVEIKSVKCPYEGYVDLLFDDGICHYCGEFHF